jgi:hypothetical protein
MKNRLIDQIIEQKAIEAREEAKIRANEKRLRKERFDISNLLVGKTTENITTYYNGHIRRKQLINNNLRLFRKLAPNKLQDIETGEIYPLVYENQRVNDNEAYIHENNLEKFESACIEILDAKGIEFGAKLNKRELREIIESKQRKDTLRF